MTMRKPYAKAFLPVSRASDAVQNQADTILAELHHSIDRARAFRDKLAARAAEKEVIITVPAVELLAPGAYEFDGTVFWRIGE